MGRNAVLETVPRQKIRDVVVERLKDLISSGDLKPGDRLPNESELALRFGVSRLSLREATKALELFGIVESKAGVGLTVGQVNLERVTGHLGFHPALQNGSPGQLIDTRIVIETGALPYTAKRMASDPTVYESLTKRVQAFRGTRDLQKWIDLDIAYHRALLDASGLAPLVAFNDLLQIFFQRFRESVKKAQWQWGIESHQRIIDLLRDQDVARASDELRLHIEANRTSPENWK
jgi:GntR family transcriptional regulator, transcriptional repressor for pyruvate dehydrogenase complex